MLEHPLLNIKRNSEPKYTTQTISPKNISIQSKGKKTVQLTGSHLSRIFIRESVYFHDFQCYSDFISVWTGQQFSPSSSSSIRVANNAGQERL